MSGARTPTPRPRYSFCTAPEVFYYQPYTYNLKLKADVYSFSVMLWEMMCLKKPFAKCKHKKEASG